MEELVSFDTAGGARLEGSLGPVEAPRGGLVLCHPHPLYGGDMDNPVVVRAAEVARESGLSTLRFNFRGVGGSGGSHDRGDGEQDDVLAALATLRVRAPGAAVGLAGYSFGAWVSSRVAARDDALAGLCLIAPPLAMFDWSAISTDRRAVLVVAGTRDPYCPMSDLDRFAERLPRARVDHIEGADHFFFGKLFPLGESIRRWTLSWGSPAGPPEARD